MPRSLPCTTSICTDNEAWAVQRPCDLPYFRAYKPHQKIEKCECEVWTNFAFTSAASRQRITHYYEASQEGHACTARKLLCASLESSGRKRWWLNVQNNVFGALLCFKNCAWLFLQNHVCCMQLFPQLIRAGFSHLFFEGYSLRCRLYAGVGHTCEDTAFGSGRNGEGATKMRLIWQWH